MKGTLTSPWLAHCAFAALVTLACVVPAPGQGTVTFDTSPGLSSTYYYESGVWFRVVIPEGASYDDMMVSVGADNTPGNGTAFMSWFRQYNPLDYVTLSLTNGGAFGLTSVRLADPTAPSPVPVPIAFWGLRADGTAVTNVFTTPGNGANSFQSYQFTPDLGSDLLNVRIDAPRWAMDELVFTVPEPSTPSLLLVGLGVLAYVRCRTSRR